MVKKNYKRSRGSYKKPVKANVQQMVAKSIQSTAELKWFYRDFAYLASAGGSTVASLTDIAQGITNSTRSGDRLRLKNITFTALFEEARTVLTAMNYIRIIIFQWYPMTTPAITDVLNSAYYIAPLRMDTRSQYKVIYDQLKGTLGGTSLMMHQERKSITFSGDTANIQFTPGTTTGTNKVYVGIVFALNGAGVNTNANLNSLVRFYDY